jgi:hypothetical protein
MTRYSVHLYNVSNTLYMYSHPRSHGSSLVFSYNTCNLQLITAQVAYTDTYKYKFHTLNIHICIVLGSRHDTDNATVLWPESSEVC